MEGLKKIRVAVKSDDIVLRDPATRERITTKGKVVPRNGFWLRRLAAGDVVELKEQTASKPEPKPAPERDVKEQGSEPVKKS